MARENQQQIFKKFHFWMIGIVLVSFSLLGFYFFYSKKNFALSSHIQNSSEITKNAMSAMKLWLDHNRSMLKMMSEDKAVIQAALYPDNQIYRQKALERLSLQHKHMSYIMNIPLVAVLPQGKSFSMKKKGKTLIVKDGDVYLDTIDGKATGINLSHMDYIKAVKSGKDNYIGKPYLSLAIHKPIFVFSQGIKVKGKLRAILIMGVRLDYFTDLLIQPLKFGKKGYMVILDSNGKIIAHPNKEWIFNEVLPVEVEKSIKKIFEGKRRFYGKISQQKRFYFADVFHFPNMENWYFTVSYPEEELFTESYRSLYLTLFIFCCVSLMLIFIYYFLSKKLIEKPIQALNEETSMAYEAQIEAIFQNSYQLTGLLDINGTLIAVNQTALQMIDADESEVLGKPFPLTPWWRNNPEGQEKLKHAMKKVLSGEVAHFETTHRDLSENLHYIDFSLKPIKNQTTGEVILLLPEGHDITERKKYEEEILKQEQQLRTLIDLSPMPMLIVDNQMKILQMNAQFVKTFGYDRDDIKTINDWWPRAYPDPEYRESLMTQWHKLLGEALRENNIIPPTLCRVTCKNGEQKIVDIMMSTGEESNFVIFNDLTELKKTEISLTESEKRFQTLVETTSDWIWEIDQQGDFTYVSPRVKELLGYEPDELIGKNAFDLMSKEEAKKVSAEYDQFVEKHLPFKGMINVNLHKDGHEVIIESSGKPFFDEKGNWLGYRGIDRDITGRIQSQQALSESEKRFSAFMNYLPAAVFIKNEQSRLLYFNQYFADFYGADSSWIGKDNFELFSGETALMLQKNDKLALERGYKKQEEILTGKNNLQRFYQMHKFSIELEENKKLLGGFGLDITDYKKAQAEIKRLADVFENIQMGIYIYQLTDLEDDHSLKLIAANPASEKLTGAEIKNILNKKIDKIFPGLRAKGIPQQYANVVRTKIPLEIEDIYYEGSYGIASSYAVKAFPLPQDCVGVTFEDVTANKKNMEELERTKSYLNNVINSMPSVLIGIDAEGKITELNREAEKASGFNTQEVSGKLFSDIFPTYKEYLEDIKKTIQNKEEFRKQKIWEKGKDSQKCLNLSAYPLVTNGIQGAVVRLDDVTDQVRLEEMMIQTEKMLSVGGLAAGMAHEINNPLGIIIQGVQNTLRRLSPELPKNNEVALECGVSMDGLHKYLEKRKILTYLKGMNEAVLRASHIVSNMLNFTRTNGQMLRTCNVESLIRNTIELAGKDYDIKKRYDFKKIKIQFELAPDFPQIFCNQSEIEQVLLNIFKNAAQAINNEVENASLGIPDYQPQIIVKAYKKDNLGVIEIADNGPGMSEDIKKRIFEPFFTTKEVGQGTGLGLSVSYFIITENHNGKIEVESEPGKGSKFVISLPLNNF